MVQSLSSQAVEGLSFLTAETVTTNMNIIFDLHGVLFSGTPCYGNSCAQIIRPTDLSKILRLLYDCSSQGHKLFALSNWNKEIYDFLKSDPQSAKILNYFDDVILASEVGIKKPDPRIFDHLMMKHRLDPQQCIFIDDKIVNIEGAQKAGIARGILCSDQDIMEIRKELQMHGAL